MKGVGQLLPSVTQSSLHSGNTSQLPLGLSLHHPHVNSDPSLDARHSEHPLPKLRQSNNVTACVCVGVCVGVWIYYGGQLCKCCTVEPTTLGEQFGRYIGVAFIEGLFCTNVLFIWDLGAWPYALYRSWPLFRGGR